MDSKSIVWISDPLQIVLIFATAIVGMFAFSSSLQGWFVTKCNPLERLLLLLVTPLMLVPNICAKFIEFIPSEYVSYGIGAAIYALIFAKQWFLRPKDSDDTHAENSAPAA